MRSSFKSLMKLSQTPISYTDSAFREFEYTMINQN
jgi:hypothetical protein